ncbi:MAG: TlpA family protein disulfide reductase [Lunatimonas sp.]|uniref:peroxiredoxin family protein n=1 Tax=Lunatimonas sp. TaxID=2060141 RepID=UPI00263B3848|nr:TlpA disulfide reductase family protein [Lunatimonas sp.]MCC5939141.1 TlpA family protein disulfide reductase [Lunatimonas sp.]
MHTRAKYTVLMLVFLFVGVLGWSIIGKYKRLQKLEATGFSIGERPMKTVEGTFLDLSDFVGKMPIMIIYFHSGCDLCRHEISQINQNRKAFEPALLVFVSSEDRTDIEEFKQSFDWESENSVYFVCDEDAWVASRFQVSKVPVSMIFGMDGQLVWRFEGPAKVASLLNHLPNSN